MKIFSLLKLNFFKTGFLLSLISTFVMAVSPLAMAEQSKKFGKETILQALKEMGALDNKNITMGEVWKKVRHKFPAYMQAQLDLPFSVYKDEKIPQFDLTEVKNSNGETVVALNIKDGGDTARIEFPGKESQFMKFNGVSLSDQDIANPNMLANKVKDEKIIKKDLEKYKTELAKKPVFPTYQDWVKMTPYQRAKLLVQIRLLMRDVSEVLSLSESQTQSSSSNFNKDYSSILNLIFGFPAEAAARDGKKPKAKTAKSNTDRKIAVGEACLVGGYPDGTVLRSGLCTLGSANSEKFKKYNMGCPNTTKGQPQMGCNPVLYGYDRSNQNPICFPYDKESPITTYATSGICEQKSPLERGNVDHAFSMIKSIALHNGKSPESFDSIFSIVTDPNTSTKKISVKDQSEYHKLMDGMFGAFNSEKDKALAVCKNIRARPTEFQRPETQQQTKACDAVEKRMLDVQLALELVRSAENNTAPPALPTEPCEDDLKKKDDGKTGLPASATEATHITPVRVVTPPISAACAADVKQVVGDKNNTDDEGGAALTKEKPKDDDNKKGGGFWGSIFNSTWAKVGLFAAALGGLAFLTVWGLSRLLKRRDTAYKPPAASPGSLPVVTPPSGSPPPIEGGAGSSPATGGGVR